MRQQLNRFGRISLCASALLAALLATSPVAAQRADERFRLDLGGFFQQYDSTIRYDSGPAFPGTPINLEKDLGLGDSSTSFRADGYWRFGKHGRLQFSYTGATREGNRVIDRDITFGGKTFHAGGNVEGRLRLNLGEVYYSYSFWNNERVEAGLMLGVSGYFTKATLEGTATVTGQGGTSTGSFSSEAKSFVAPIPAIGAHARVAIVPGLEAFGLVKGLKGSISGYYGSMVDARGGLDWRFSKHFGVGAAYQYVKIVFEHDEDQTLRLEMQYDGPLGYLSLWF